MPAMAMPTTAIDSGEPLLLEASRLYELGRSAIRSDSYAEAAEFFSKALEIRVQHYGELSLECASTFYNYGCALLYKVQAESDALVGQEARNGQHQGSSSADGKKEVDTEDSDEDDDDGAAHDGDVGTEEGGGGEEGEEEDPNDEEEGDIELAWKMLDIARVIYGKEPQRSLAEVDVITALADVSLEKELFQMCYEDYETALKVLENLVEPDNRRIAELCFKISLAKQLNRNPQEALEYCKRAVSICEQRVDRLSKELAKVKIPGEANGHFVGGVEKLSNKEERVESSERETTQSDGLGSTSEAPLQEEVKEINELLVDLREKVEELEQMAAAPTLLDALKVANPEAVAMMSAVYSRSLGLGTSGKGGFDTNEAGTSSTAVTNLGVVGRGIKRATPTPVTEEQSGHPDVQPRKRSVDEVLNGGNSGGAHIDTGGSC